MAENPAFDFNIKPADFSVLFASPAAVQDALKHLEFEAYDKLMDYHETHSSKLNSGDLFLEDQEEAKRYKELIETTEHVLSVATNPKNIAMHKANLESYKNSYQRFLSRMEKRDSTKLLDSKMIFQLNHAVAESKHKLAISIGEWFETGAVGQGTVTYKDMTFKSE